MTKEIQITNFKTEYSKKVLIFEFWNYFVICALIFVIILVMGCAQEGKNKVKSIPGEEVSTSPQEEAQSPAEALSSFSVSGYAKGGKKQWDLEGKNADIMSEEIKLTTVTGKVYGKEINMTIVADKGNLNRIDNNVHLEKNVRATTDDGAILTTDYLDWDAQNQKLTSDAPVWVKRGMMEAFGTGVVGQPTLNSVQMKKDVTVTVSLPARGNSTQKQDPDNLSLSESSAATVITCDGPLDVDYQNNQAIFQDNIKVKDMRGEIFADRMDVYFSSQNEKNKQIEGMEGMGIDKIEAEGFVEIHRGANTAYSQKAIYDTNTGKLTLTGQPKLVIYSTEGFSQLK